MAKQRRKFTPAFKAKVALAAIPSTMPTYLAVLLASICTASQFIRFARSIHVCPTVAIALVPVAFGFLPR